MWDTPELIAIFVENGHHVSSIIDEKLNVINLVLSVEIRKKSPYRFFRCRGKQPHFEGFVGSGSMGPYNQWSAPSM